MIGPGTSAKIVVGAGTLLLLLPIPSQAQTPSGDAQLALEGVPEDPIELAPGASTRQEVDVTYRASDVACTQGLVTVQFGARFDGPGVSVAFEPASMTFAVSGAYGNESPEGSYNASKVLDVTITADTSTPEGRVPVELTADASGVEPPECIPALPPTNATAREEIDVSSASGSGTGPNDSVGPVEGEEDQGVPGASWALLLLMLALLARISGRR